MTVIETTPRTGRLRVAGPERGQTSVRGYAAQNLSLRPVRPGGAALRHAGTGVSVSRTPHRRRAVAPRPITPAATVALAVVAAAITVWLGLVAHFGAAVTHGATSGDSTTGPDRLGVVQVQAGESLWHLAARVAPDAPAGQVADRIRELNGLDSVQLDAGQTLIAPIG